MEFASPLLAIGVGQLTTLVTSISIAKAPNIAANLTWLEKTQAPRLFQNQNFYILTCRENQ